MNIAPSDRRLARWIVDLVKANAFVGEQVLFIGSRGEVRDRLDIRTDDDADTLLTRRAAMLNTGELRAILHLLAPTPAERPVMQVVMCEVYDDPAHPTVHAIVRWPSEHRWTPVPTSATDQWIERWYSEGKEGNSDS